FLFKISTKTNKKELAIKPLLFVYSLDLFYKRVLKLFFRENFSYYGEQGKEKSIIFFVYHLTNI
ncbi:hypothetical protein SJ900_14275, partial [Enterococcus faecium]